MEENALTSKECAGPGVNVSVPEYVFMHQQYGMGQRFASVGEEGLGDLLERTQAAIVQSIAGQEESILDMDEADLSQLPS